MIIYTAALGATALPAPRHASSTERHVLFSQDNVSIPGWQVRSPMWPVGQDPDAAEARHQAMSHELFPSEPITVWVHPRIQPKFNLEPWAAKWLRGSDLVVRKDPESCCCYQRLRWLGRSRPELEKELKQQREEYGQRGLPFFAGLFDASLLIRRQSPIVTAFNTTWWEQRQRYPSVPAASLSFCAWLLRLYVGAIPGRFGDPEDAFVSSL